MERASEKRNAINDGLVALRSFPLNDMVSGRPLNEAHLSGSFPLTILKVVGHLTNCVASVIQVGRTPY